MRFGVSRAHGSQTLVAGAHAFVEALGRELGLPVRVAVLADYDALLAALVDGDVDLAWMPPLPAARALQRGAHPVAVAERRGAVSYRSALLVRADGPIASTAHLLGLPSLRVAWTDPSSAAGHYFPLRHLRRLGIDGARLDERFLGGAPAACAAVAADQADLCACFVTDGAGEDLKLALADVARIYAPAAWRLRVLAVTDRIPADTIVVAPKTDRAGISTALLSIAGTEEGRTALSSLMQADRLVAPSEVIRQALAALAI
jgi:ABC-type phosphate/phosphonate transport system substrate-binding protein